MCVCIHFRRIWLLVVLVCAATLATSASPDPCDGIRVFYLLCEPFGAYGVNLWNNFERLGWDVTTGGTHAVVKRCNRMTTDVEVDIVIDGSIGLGPFDVLAISPTKGTHRLVSDPASDLRESDAALELVRQAHKDGVTLYAGCSSFLVLADAGVLEGRQVVHSAKYASVCSQAGAECSSGGKEAPPIVDGNVVTGTNQRYYALEIPEAIARSLDRLDTFEPTLDLLQLTDLPLDLTGIEPDGAVVGAFALGTRLSDLAYDVCSFEDGFIAVGQTYGGEGGNADALIIRFGPDAQPLWARALGGPGRDVAHSVCSTSDGAIAIAGLTTSVGAGGEDALLFKLSPDGDLLWKKTHGGVGADAGFSISEASNGDLLISGISHTPDSALSALYVVRANEAGDEVWSTRYDGDLHERGLSIVERADGSILVAGGSSSLTRKNYDMIVGSFSSQGEVQQVRSYTAGVYDIAEDVILTADGNSVIVGFRDTGNSAGDPNNVLIAKIGPDGALLWTKSHGFPNSFEYGQGIVEIEPGVLLACGASTGVVSGLNDVWFVAQSETGDEVWEKRFGADEDSEWANAVCQLADGRIVSVGWTRSYGAGSHDALVMVLDPALILF